MQTASTPKVLIVGHRGAKGLAPENTLESFEIAIKHGVDQIETDVRLTSDGQVVIVHDKKFTDAQRKQLRVIDATYPQLRAHNSSLLTLDEAITHVNRRVRLMIEVKQRVQTEPVILIVNSFLSEGWRAEDFIFASFDYKVLQEVQTALPQIELVVLERWSSIRAVSRARRLQTKYISMDQSFLWSGVVRSLCKRYKLFTYPSQHIPHRPTDPTRPLKWTKYGIHGIITDYPDRFEH
ncbi:glycerophosphodiester phosphodiesterase [Aeromicrobium sp.]|nr:glycerophosphodiester phosphodiesterase [Candidatus Saccharibacteria bacterium]